MKPQLKVTNMFPLQRYTSVRCLIERFRSPLNHFLGVHLKCCLFRPTMCRCFIYPPIVVAAGIAHTKVSGLPKVMSITFGYADYNEKPCD